METCLQETSRVLNVAHLERPRIVIFQLSPKDAKRLGLTETMLMASAGTAGTFYEVWLAGGGELRDLARAVEMVYELHFGLKYDQTTRGRLVADISTRLHQP